jgi:hypothetical protein
MPFKIRILPLAPKVLLFDCFSWVRYELKIGGEFILGHDSFYCFSRVNFKFLHQLLTLREPKLDIQYAEVGVCGLSCRLCSMYHTQTESRCAGCKSYARMAVGCPFITCAVKKKGIEFAGNAQKTQHVKNGENTGTQADRKILSSVIKSLKTIFYLFEIMVWLSLKKQQKSGKIF